jgi:hypothetical protein
LDPNINLHELQTAVLGELFPMLKKVVSRAVQAATSRHTGPAEMAKADSAALTQITDDHVEWAVSLVCGACWMSLLMKNIM